MGDIFSGIFFILLSAFVIFTASGYRHYSLREGWGPGSMPILYAVILLSLSVILIISALIKRNRANSDKQSSDSLSLRAKDDTSSTITFEQIKAPAITAVVLFTYLFLLRPLGFLASTPFLIICVMKIMGAKIRYSILAAILLTGATYLIFRILLGVPIPGLPYFMR